MKDEVEWADPDLLAQVTEAMSNCEDNGYWDETIALGPEGIRDDLIEKDADIGGADPAALLVAVKTFLAGKGLLTETPDT